MQSENIPLNKPTIGDRHSKPEKWEYLIPAFITIVLIISCILVSSKKYYWNDELYSYYLLSEDTFSQMWGSFNDKINNTPPLYFVLGWLWAKLFSASELSLRLFSSIGFALSCWITWTILRRTFSFVATSIGVLVPYCASTLVLYQNSEARMYGLYMTVCAIGLLLYDTINKKANPGTKLLIANAVIHALFIQTHLHGLFFSGAVLASFIATDWYFNRFRPKVYLSIVVGWLSFLLYLPAFLIQIDAGNPRTWIYLPSWRDLVDTLTLFEYSQRQWDTPFPVTHWTWLKLTLLVSVLGLAGWLFIRSLIKNARSGQIRQGTYHGKENSIPLMFLAGAFMVMPPLVWCISYVIKPVFMDRYLMPILLSWTIIGAYLTTYFGQFIKKSSLPNKLGLSHSRLSTVYSIVFICIALELLNLPIYYAVRKNKEGLPGDEDKLYGYESLPMVVTKSNDFLKRMHYSPQRDRYRFVLDWPSAVDKASGMFPPQEYKHLQALNRRYPNYFKNQIIQSKDFLKDTKRFLVLDFKNYKKRASGEPTVGNLQSPQWFSRVILSDPKYKVTFLGEMYSYWIITLVEAK
jgi:hypothetical protein